MTRLARPDASTVYRVAAAAGAVVFGIAALAAAVTSARHSDLLATAWRLDRGSPVSRATLDGLAAGIDAIARDGSCRDDLVRAASVVALAAVDTFDPVNDYDRWADALGRATAVLGHAAACNPADGLRWALLAAAEWSAGEEPQRLSALLSMSARRSPVELRALRARADLWARTSLATRAAARDVFERDVGLLVTGAEPEVVAAAFGHNDADLRETVASAASALPDQRREALAAAGLDFVR